MAVHLAYYFRKSTALQEIERLPGTDKAAPELSYDLLHNRKVNAMADVLIESLSKIWLFNGLARDDLVRLWGANS